MMKLHIPLAAAAAAAIVLAGCSSQNFGGEDTPSETGPIAIGAVLDVTGPGATLGVPQQNTLQMLADQLNEAGGIDGREVELTIVDNQSTEDAAARAVSDLIEQDDVDSSSAPRGPARASRCDPSPSRTRSR